MCVYVSIRRLEPVRLRSITFTAAMYIGVPALGSVGQLPVGPVCFWCALLAIMHTPGLLLQLHVLAQQTPAAVLLLKGLVQCCTVRQGGFCWISVVCMIGLFRYG